MVEKKRRVRYVMDGARECLACHRKFFPKKTVSGVSTTHFCGKKDCKMKLTVSDKRLTIGSASWQT